MDLLRPRRGSPIITESLAQTIGERLAPARELLLPSVCVACAEPGSDLCTWCLPDAPGSVRRVSGLDVHAAAPYEGSVRAAILAHKDAGIHSLARPLAVLLVRSIRAALAPYPGFGTDRRPLLLVPVPSSRRARRRRGGYDPVASIGRRASHILCKEGLSVDVWKALRIVGTPADQSGLDARQRRTNVAGQIRSRSRLVRRPPQGAVVVLIDDVITTGSTISATCAALPRDCATPIAGAVIADVPRRLSR